MADQTSATSKEAFFEMLNKLDSDDEPVAEEGRLASETFLKGSKEGTSKKLKKSSSALHHRGSSRNTSPSSIQADEPRPSNTLSHAFTAQKMQRTASAPVAASSLGSSGRDGND